MASPSSTSKRLYELDLLRFVAAVAVVLFHLSFLGERSGASPSAFPTLAHATKYGYLGVDFFFILSGFVILMSAKGRSAVSFARARVVRLFPAYIAAVALTSGVLYLDGRGPSSGQFVANLTMTQAVFREGHIDGAYWSLLVEMRFYALIAVVIAVGGLKHVENLTLAWLGYLLITDFVALPSIASTVLIDQHAHLFIAGMTYALVRAEQQMTTRRLVVLMWCWASATTMALGQAEVMATRHETPFYPAVIVGASVLFFATFAPDRVAGDARTPATLVRCPRRRELPALFVAPGNRLRDVPSRDGQPLGCSRRCARRHDAGEPPDRNTP